MTFARRARLEKELRMIAKDPNPEISVAIPTGDASHEGTHEIPMLLPFLATL